MRPRSGSATSSVASVAVRQLRDELGFTQQQFAVYLGVSMGTIARYETDRTPRVKALETGRKIRRELIELSSLLIPEGEAKAMPQPAEEYPNS